MLNERQLRTYEMLAKGDRNAAEIYKQQCLDRLTLVMPPHQHHPESKVCIQCKNNFYRKISESISNFNKRKYCCKKCSNNAKVVNRKVRSW